MRLELFASGTKIRTLGNEPSIFVTRTLNVAGPAFLLTLVKFIAGGYETCRNARIFVLGLRCSAIQAYVNIIRLGANYFWRPLSG